MISQIVILFAVAYVATASLAPIEHHAPKPYKFGYDIKDKHGEQYRHEDGNGIHAVKGSYGFTDARGIKRQVNYVADQAGFRAQVNTNEPGTANSNPAAVQINSDAHYAGGAALSGLGLGHGNHGLGGNGGYGLGGHGGYGLGGHGGYGLGGHGSYGLGGHGGYGHGGHGGYGLGGFGYGVPALGYARYGY